MAGHSDKLQATIEAVARIRATGTSRSPVKDAATETGVPYNLARKWAAIGYFDEPDIERLQLVVHAHKIAGTIAGAAADLKMDRFYVSQMLKLAARRGLYGTDPVMPGFEINRVSTQEDEDGNITARHIQQKQESGDKYAVPEGFEIVRDSARIDEDNRRRGGWKISKPARRDPKILAVEFAKALSGKLPPVVPRPAPDHTLDDLLTVYPIVDWHIGLLAWSEETGMENWDTSIARDIIMQSMLDVMRLTKASKRCVLLNTGDMMHFDGYEPKTSRSGHVLDTDTRYPKIRRTAVAMFDECVGMALDKHEHVEVVSLPGNHDDQSAGWIGLALEMKYRDREPRVHVHEGSNRIWWDRPGEQQLFLGAAHGDQAKPKDLPLMMAVDRPKDWAAARRKVIYTGHIHHEVTKEIGGVRVHSLRTPTAKDAYHSWHAWRAGRSVYADTYSLDGRYATRETMDLAA